MRPVTVLGFDFGTHSIGIAVGQSLLGTANPLGAVKAKEGIPHWPDVDAFFAQWQPDVILVGLPLNMDGSEQPITARAKKFGRRLHARYGLSLYFHDERLTTVDAKAQLFAQGGYRTLDKKNIDAAAAQLIVTSWFENHGLAAAPVLP